MEQCTLKELLLYSPKSGVFYWIVPPSGHSDLLGEPAGSVQVSNGKQYHIIQICGKKYKRSHLAWLYMEGTLHTDDVIDHEDGNSLNDKWQNLRPASFLQNAQNRKTGKPNKVLPMGVRVVKNGNFCARITVNGRQLSLGSFPTPELASAAYQSARRKYFAEFA
jgi:hypothetical protein